MHIDQAEMQQTLGRFFKFSHQSLSRCLLLIEQNKVNQSFLKGHLGVPFTLSGVVSDNNTTYSCKIQHKDVHKEVTVNCNCKKNFEHSTCEHILSLFYAFYQQQILQGSLLQQEVNNFDSDSAKSPRFGIVIRSPQDLITKQRTHSFTDLKFTLTTGEDVSLSTAKDLPSNTEFIITILQAKDENGKIILHQNQALFYLQTSLNIDGVLADKINILGSDLIFNWENGQCYNIPIVWKPFFKKHQQSNLLQSVDEQIFYIYQNFPKTDFYIEDKKISFQQAETVRLNLNISEGKIASTYHLSIAAKHHDQSVTTPLFLSLFAEKNNPFSLTGTPFDAQRLAQILLKYKFSLDSVETTSDFLANINAEKNKFLSTWLDDTENELLNLISSIKDKSRAEDWINAWTHTDVLFSYDHHSHELTRWQTKEIIFVLAKLTQFWGAQLFKKSEWLNHRCEIVFEIGHHTLFKNIGDAYRDLNLLNLDVYWQQKPLYQWKTNSRIQRVNRDMDWFDLKININFEDLKILQQIQNNSTVQWLDGKMILLSDEQKIFSQLLKKYLPSQIEENSEQQVTIKIQKSRIFELFYLKNLGFDQLLTPEEEELCQSLLNLKSIPQYPVPDRYENVLRSYQKDGFRWLKFLFDHQLGGCLADDMGLGKTVQSIALMQAMQDKLNKVLIICPVSILWNWQQELTKFSDLKVKLYYADQRTISPDDKIILTSYGLLKRDFESTFSNLKLDLLILDEVQQLKNYHSLGSQLAKRLQTKVRFVLTGTPVENEITEFYNILELCVPGLWGDHKWQRRGFEEAKSVAKIMSKPFVLRRTKEQVLKELPEKTEQLIYLSFTPEEEHNYNLNLAQIQQSLLETNNKQVVGQVLKNLLQLRQLCLWQEINHVEISSKINFMMETATQLIQEKHSIIIFSQFTSYLDRIQKQIKSLNVGISRIDGSQSLKSRQENVNKFQDGTNAIFLISLRAGGFGLNLTKASYLFLMDPWWNPAVENQAIDRAHRIGQNKHITVYRPIIKNSVEEKVLKLQQEKKKLFDELVNADNGEHFSGRLTMDDFKFLLS